MSLSDFFYCYLLFCLINPSFFHSLLFLLSYVTVSRPYCVSEFTLTGPQGGSCENLEKQWEGKGL